MSRCAFFISTIETYYEENQILQELRTKEASRCGEEGNQLSPLTSLKSWTSQRRLRVSSNRVSYEIAARISVRYVPSVTETER